ncbi:Ribosomal RNA small subunit methyltransferase D [hydrothermal vent metagenome]|uniref:Ribosomal RNA small subunit methyltransferase D n=1 Tax=hydrothermal vent metagenome TaxID=652676 RepID=A0A1W1BTP5_9ZZZZ
MKPLKIIKNNKSEVRLIGGVHKGRKIFFSEIEGLRPTPNRLRETLFNWLQFDIRNANILDLFAGSGALGFEAYSRGAKKVFLVEKNKIAYQNLLENKNNLKSDNIEVIKEDAFVFLKNNIDNFDIIFCDPPFNKGLIDKLIINFTMLKNVIVYFELEYKLSALPKNWDILKQKKVASVFAYLVQID